VFETVEDLRWKGPRENFEEWCQRMKAPGLLARFDRREQESAAVIERAGAIGFRLVRYALEGTWARAKVWARARRRGIPRGGGTVALFLQQFSEQIVGLKTGDSSTVFEEAM